MWDNDGTSAPDRNCCQSRSSLLAYRRTRQRKQPLAAPRRTPTQALSSLSHGGPARACLQLPMRALARIIRKELAGNEENPAKPICLPLASAGTHHMHLLADSCISGIRPGHRCLSPRVGEVRLRDFRTVDAANMLIHFAQRGWGAAHSNTRSRSSAAFSRTLETLEYATGLTPCRAQLFRGKQLLLQKRTLPCRMR